MEFNNLATDLFLDKVHFFINGQNVLIYLVLKGNKVSTQFLIGFFLVGRIHEGMSGGSMEKKNRQVIYTTMIMEMRRDQWDKWGIRVPGRYGSTRLKKR
jgi:hypothetical protein